MLSIEAIEFIFDFLSFGGDCIDFGELGSKVKRFRLSPFNDVPVGVGYLTLGLSNY